MTSEQYAAADKSTMGQFGRPSTYDPKYCAEVVKHGAEGMSPAEISDAMGIPRKTMASWAEVHEEFRAAMTEAKTREQAWWERMARTNLTADRFQQQIWAKSMCARFRDDYTERRQIEGGGANSAPIVIQISQDDDKL